VDDGSLGDIGSIYTTSHLAQGSSPPQSMSHLHVPAVNTMLCFMTHLQYVTNEFGVLCPAGASIVLAISRLPFQRGYRRRHTHPNCPSNNCQPTPSKLHYIKFKVENDIALLQTLYKHYGNDVLKVCRASNGADTTSRGSSFQTVALETGNARLPTVEKRTAGMFRLCEVEDRSRRLGPDDHLLSATYNRP